MIIFLYSLILIQSNFFNCHEINIRFQVNNYYYKFFSEYLKKIFIDLNVTEILICKSLIENVMFNFPNQLSFLINLTLPVQYIS